MKVQISYKSRYTGNFQAVEYSATKITSDAFFLNVIDEQGELHGFPIRNLIRLCIEDNHTPNN